MYQTKNGYTIYPANDWHKHPYLFCRKDPAALSDIRDWLQEFKQPIEIHNAYETFYGCDLDGWLEKGLGDIADLQVTEMQSSRGYGPDFPGAILLTPKTK